jgi:hypothetical protein
LFDHHHFNVGDLRSVPNGKWSQFKRGHKVEGKKAKVLSLQETLLGCKSEMPGNLIFLETIFSIIDVGLDQDEYLNLWIVSSRQSNYIHAIQGLQELFIR